MARRQQKKRFPCGHRGLGAFCHRCAQEAAAQRQQQAIQADHQAERAAWIASFEQDTIDLRVIQHRRDLVQKARDVIKSLANGTHPMAIGGKAFHSDRRVISVAISYDYRLVFQASDEEFLPVALESHETYNHRT